MYSIFQAISWVTLTDLGTSALVAIRHSEAISESSVHLTTIQLTMSGDANTLEGSLVCLQCLFRTYGLDFLRFGRYVYYLASLLRGAL